MDLFVKTNARNVHLYVVLQKIVLYIVVESKIQISIVQFLSFMIFRMLILNLAKQME